MPLADGMHFLNIHYVIGKGQIIGTNRSVAAPTLISWRGRLVSNAEMRALSMPEAKQIYKVKYWDKIKGDYIQGSQDIADVLADMKSSAGGNAIKQMQKVLNSFGENLKIDGGFGNASLDALNRQIKKQGEARVFNAFQKSMVAYYQNINSPFTKQWVSSLQRDYPLKEETKSTQALTSLVVLGAVLLATYGLFELNKINA
jgi:lysozyme family protein